MDLIKTLDDNKAGIALFFSFASLYFSARTTWLDRARIVAKPRPYVYDRGDGKTYNHFEILIYNHGRRDAAIDKVVYKYTGGLSIYHDNGNTPIILKENQKHVIKLDYNDLIHTDREGDIHELEDIEIINIKGKVIPIPKSKEHILKVHETFPG